MVATAPVGFIALQRFGLGARPGDLEAIAADARDAVLAEIGPDSALIENSTLPDTVSAISAVRDLQMARKAAKAAAPQPGDSATADDAAPDMTSDLAPDMATPGRKGKARKPPRGAADANTPGNPLAPEMAARLAQAVAARVGFAERWAMFWTNHFAVEADSNQLVRWTVGAFDREAIRPHVFGRFEELLFAVTQHPAMLRYLNNASSIGPDSKAGLQQNKGLNENHARELMELHTIGVDAGYTQADVIAVAKVLTGWTFGQNPRQAERFARFFFNPRTHEPGAQTVLKAVYAQPGEKQGDAVLAMLAGHSATATHIAGKLVRHFVADTPPPELVGAIAAVFDQSGGDLAQVAKALLTADAAWSAPMQKLRLPQEYLLAAARGLGVTPKPPQLLKALATLGQPLFNPPSPEGFHDDAATWLAPDAMTNRLDIAQNFAQQADASADARQVADALLGEAQSAATREAVARAESPVQGLTILLMSPEFQRR